MKSGFVKYGKLEVSDNQLLIGVLWASMVENDSASGRQWMMKGGKGNDPLIRKDL